MFVPGWCLSNRSSFHMSRVFRSPAYKPSSHVSPNSICSNNDASETSSSGFIQSFEFKPPVCSTMVHGKETGVSVWGPARWRSVNSNASLARSHTGRTRALRVIDMDDETLSSSSPLVGGNYPPNQTLHSSIPEEIGLAGMSDLLRFCCVVPWLF